MYPDDWTSLQGKNMNEVLALLEILLNTARDYRKDNYSINYLHYHASVDEI